MSAWCFICAKPQPCAHTKVEPKPPARELAVRRHLGAHPLTETTCDYAGCWCHPSIQTIVRAREMSLRELAEQRERALRPKED